MVQFVTLFLGALVTGSVEVQLAVHEEVAALEVRLDQDAVATLRGAPWQLRVDFGEELAPHLLEAVAYARDGRELGRASQWVNLNSRATEISIALGRDPSTGKVEAHLSWQSLSPDNEPVLVRALLDGEAFHVQSPRLIALPEHDPDRLHHLRVELEFPGSLRSVAEVTFGGQYGERVSSGLTAFPVSLDGRGELPPIDEMQDWFRSRDRRLRVHAAEKGLAEIVVVRSPAARRYLVPRPRRGPRTPLPILSRDHRLRFIGASPALVPRDQSPFVVFPRSEEVGVRVGGLRQTLSSVSLPSGRPAEVRLSDAVAVAGLFANRSARRRAVVLIITSDSNDASQYDPQQVRPYLASIGVPLVVWNPEAGKEEAGRWGAAFNISTDSLLDEAYRRLSRALASQRIVWLEGLHLPQTVVLDREIDGVRLLR